MNKSNFDELLHRYLTGQVSEAERIKIEKWLETMKHNDDPHFRLSEEEEEELFQKISDMTNQEEAKPRSMGTKRSFSLKIAASVSVILLAAVITWFVSTDANKTFTSDAANETQKVILNDGTIVWLRGKSSIDYFDHDNGGSSRRAVLHGDALFEVAKDEKRPFIITWSNSEVRVLGTSFMLEHRGDTLAFSVLTGKVNVTDMSRAVDVELMPNNKLMILGNEVIARAALSKSDISKITVSTEYDMSFENVLLGDVITRLEEKFEKDIDIRNDAITQCRITADFTDHSFERSLDMITEVLNVEYEVQGGRITLSGSGCK